MNILRKNSVIHVLLLLIMALAATMPVAGQNRIVYDAYHGQNPANAETFKSLLPTGAGAGLEVLSKEMDDAVLKGKDGLIIFSPTKTFSEPEKTAVVNYLKAGGSLFLIFDEERRTPLTTVGINDVITPFGIQLTDDAPVRHNCGAIADSSSICAGRRELPYSGGRSIKGGNLISRVNYEGDYIHSAYLTLPGGGKIIVMSDGMAGLLLGGPDGERFSGTGPSDSKYWGKDSKVFMQELLQFWISDK